MLTWSASAHPLFFFFCRTGKYFALEHFDVRPDILIFAKAIASGYAVLSPRMRLLALLLT